MISYSENQCSYKHWFYTENTKQLAPHDRKKIHNAKRLEENVNHCGLYHRRVRIYSILVSLFYIFFFFLQTKTLRKLNVGSLVILSRDGAHLSPGSWLHCPSKCTASACSPATSATAFPPSRPHRCLWHSGRMERAEGESEVGKSLFGHLWGSQILRAWEQNIIKLEERSRWVQSLGLTWNLNEMSHPVF